MASVSTRRRIRRKELIFKRQRMTVVPSRKAFAESYVGKKMGLQTKKDEVNNSSFEDVFENLGEKPVQEVLKWLLSDPKIFFEEFWEKKPFTVHGHKAKYDGLYNRLEFERILNKNHLDYNKEVLIETYVDGDYKTLEYDFKAHPAYVWASVVAGYSVRIRNSQFYCKSLESLCSYLQEYFSNHVEANTYLRRPNIDFPPRCNDTEAFIMQIEGNQLYKLYIPSASQILAKQPSGDLYAAETKKPSTEVELKPGDLLYIPSGYIYQAEVTDSPYGLHILLALSDLNTWGNFLRHAFCGAIDEAIQNDGEFRKSIPMDYLDYMGQLYADNDSKERQNFKKKAVNLIEKTVKLISLDAAADANGISFVRGSVPPDLTSLEKSCSAHSRGACFENGKVLISAELDLETKIQFIRKRACKLMVDSDGSYLCHSLFNQNKDNEEGELNLIPVEPENVSAIAELFRTEKFLKIKDLPHEESSKLLKFLQMLYENGVIKTECPLPMQ